MRAVIAVLAVCVVSAPGRAQAQQPPAPSKPVVTIERVENQWVLVPEAKLTDLNGDLGNLVGFTGGWLREETLLVGGAAYWLINGPGGWDLAYGGLAIGTQWRGDRAVTFGARGLIGAGEATRTVTFRSGFPWPWPGGQAMPLNFGPRGTFSNVIPMPMPGEWRVDVSNRFIVFEPQATVMLRVTRRIRFGVSAGYRLTGGAESFGDDLNGATGTVSIQFGVGGR